MKSFHSNSIEEKKEEVDQRSMSQNEVLGDKGRVIFVTKNSPKCLK